jgi:hypothetical protein
MGNDEAMQRCLSKTTDGPYTPLPRKRISAGDHLCCDAANNHAAKEDTRGGVKVKLLKQVVQKLESM